MNTNLFSIMKSLVVIAKVAVPICLLVSYHQFNNTILLDTTSLILWIILLSVISFKKVDKVLIPTITIRTYRIYNLHIFIASLVFVLIIFDNYILHGGIARQLFWSLYLIESLIYIKINRTIEESSVSSSEESNGKNN